MVAEEEYGWIQIRDIAAGPCWWCPRTGASQWHQPTSTSTVPVEKVKERGSATQGVVVSLAESVSVRVLLVFRHDTTAAGESACEFEERVSSLGDAPVQRRSCGRTSGLDDSGSGDSRPAHWIVRHRFFVLQVSAYEFMERVFPRLAMHEDTDNLRQHLCLDDAARAASKTVRHFAGFLHDQFT